MQMLSSSPPSVPVLHPLMGQDDDLEADDEFTIFHLWSQLLKELFAIFSWYEAALDPELQQGALALMKGVSIFAGTTPKEDQV